MRHLILRIRIAMLRGRLKHMRARMSEIESVYRREKADGDRRIGRCEVEIARAEKSLATTAPASYYIGRAL